MVLRNAMAVPNKPNGYILYQTQTKKRIKSFMDCDDGLQLIFNLGADKRLMTHKVDAGTTYTTRSYMDFFSLPPKSVSPICHCQ